MGLHNAKHIYFISLLFVKSAINSVTQQATKSRFIIDLAGFAFLRRGTTSPKSS